MRIAALLLPLIGLFVVQAAEDKAPKRPALGDNAPTIRLNDHLGKAQSIGGQAETWTVLAFYPKSATPG